METDRLIEGLTVDLRPVSARQAPVWLGGAALIGGGVALAAVILSLGLRPDLSIAMAGQMFWVKAGYGVVLAVAGFWCAERLSRPVASSRAGWWLGGAAFAILALSALANLMGAPAEARMGAWLGGSWQQCPLYIPALSIPTLGLSLAVMRGLAPTRLRLAGAAAGAFSGGVAATAYGLHCGETAPAFLATWYSLGVVLSAGLGALLGPFALRWR